MYELSKLYPAISGIQPDYGWSVPVAISPDGYPCIGPHRNYPRHLFAFGSGHNGVGSALMAARVLLRQYLGAPEKGDDLFGLRGCWGSTAGTRDPGLGTRNPLVTSPRLRGVGPGRVGPRTRPTNVGLSRNAAQGPRATWGVWGPACRRQHPGAAFCRPA